MTLPTPDPQGGSEYENEGRCPACGEYVEDTTVCCKPTNPHPDQRIEEAASEIAREITLVGGLGPDEWNALVEINRLRLRPMLRRFHDAAWDAGKRAGAEEHMRKVGQEWR